MEITSEVLEVTAETIEGVSQDHVTFRLRSKPIMDLTDNGVLDIEKPNGSQFNLMDGKQSRLSMRKRSIAGMENLNDLNIDYPESTIINGKLFCDLFPFHVVFDKDLIIKQCGTKLQKMAGNCD